MQRLHTILAALAIATAANASAVAPTAVIAIVLRTRRCMSL